MSQDVKWVNNNWESFFGEPLIRPEGRGLLAAAHWYLEQEPRSREPDYALALCESFNVNLSDLSVGIIKLQREVAAPILLKVKDRDRMKATWHVAQRAKGQPLTMEEILGIANTCREMEEMEQTNATNE